ncbi:MAG: hypothetical protein AB7G44_16860 [Bacteroidia bacterium]
MQQQNILDEPDKQGKPTQRPLSVWVRIIASGLGAGMMSEIIHISTGDPDRPRPEGSNGLTFVVFVLIFIVLTFFVNRQKKKES